MTIEYAVLANHVDLTSKRSLLVFNALTIVIKFILQTAVKSFVVMWRPRHLQHIVYMIMAPTLILEIQVRITLLRARSTLPLYVGSGVLGFVEICTRLLIACFERYLIRRRQRHVDHEKRQLMQRCHGCELENGLDALETNFARWKNLRLRLFAIKALADMSSEYCGIVFASVITVMLGRNPFYDIGARSSAATTNATVVDHLASAFLPLSFELGSDVIASLVELRLGFPLLSVVKQEHTAFLRTVVLVATRHSGAISVSSFLRSSST
ncbi:hypothetical protein PINS_up007534 [Pythium insidiosum]|nr:hypothetical protein PINS_up007534 [Pythium insidiosum]